MSELPDPTGIASFWDSVAHDYYANYHSALKDTAWLDHTMSSLFPSSKKMKIADIGTGCGSLSIPLARLGHDVTATEISKNMIEEAISSAIVHEANVHFIEDDILSTQLPKDSFDLVILKDVLFTLADPFKGMQHCLELVSPGGLIAIIDGNYFLNGKLDEYTKRANYHRLKTGHEECADLLHLNGEQFHELERLVGSMEINSVKRPNSEMHMLLDNGFDIVRVICNTSDQYTYLSENGKITPPIRYIVLGKRHLNTDNSFIKKIEGIRGDSYLSKMNSDAAELVFLAVSNRDRIKIIKLLMLGSKSVKELADRLGLTENKTSYHLKILKESGFVVREKVGREVFYSINDGFLVSDLLRAADRIYRV